MKALQLTERTIGIWFVSLGAEQSDWMGFAEALEDGSYAVTSRFRVYVDDRAIDSDDKKIWDRFTTKPGTTRAQVMQSCRNVAEKLKRDSRGRMWECVRGQDESLHAFAQRFIKLPFVHSRTEKLQ